MQLISEAQLCGFELLETILSLCLFHHKHFGWIEPIAELARRVLFVQKDLGLQYVTKVSSVMLPLFVIFIQLELEHEQLSVLKLLHFLLKWKYGDGMVNSFVLIIFIFFIPFYLLFVVLCILLV